MVHELLGTGTPHQGVVGNGSMTACIRPDGNLGSIYWPHMGYAEQLKEAAAGVHLGQGKGAKFLWLDVKHWDITQSYRDHCNIIETKYRGNGVSISRASFVDPRLDAFVTTFTVSTASPDSKDVSLLLYQNPELEETKWGNATFYDSVHDSIFQYRRGTYFAFGAVERSESHQCGISGWKDDARADCEDGRLMNSNAALYRGRRGVNSALAYSLGAVSAKRPRSLCYLTTAGGDLERAVVLLETARSMGPSSLTERSVRHWESLVRTKRRTGGHISALVERSILTLLQLCDRKTGGIIASPSTDPDYRYVWPRDAFYVALALDRSGYHEQAERFYMWCTRAQDRSGVLRQRYYSSPELIGPAWGPAWGEEIDETACVLWGMVEHRKLTQDVGFLSEVWPFVREAAWNLVDRVDRSGKVMPTMNLWEEQPSRHIYSTATVAGGLRSASNAAAELGYAKEASRWGHVSELVKKQLLDEFWDDGLGHFVRTAEPRDEQVDISSLAVSFPFGVVPDSDPRAMRNARALTESFRYPAGGLGRFPTDNNYGGNPWIISTCWMSIHNSLAGDAAAGRALLDWSARHASGLGMLPEQVDKTDGTVLSAVPLAWSHAMFILASQALARSKHGKTLKRR